MNESTRKATSSNLAPVILFAFTRPDHLKSAVTSLLGNAEAAATHLTVYCDAPKRPEQRPAVDEVRHYVESISGFASVTRVYRTENMGLARSIIAGVTETLQAHDRVIVLEDDLVLSPHFLHYMNDALTCYQRDDQVASVHGYWYPTDVPLPATFFLRGADCWGWATWSRAWSHFEPDGSRLLAQVREKQLSREIDYDGTFPHIKILKRQIRGRNDSWAIRWHVSCYLRNMLTLYPSRSLVENIGHDNSGTHCATSQAYAGDLASSPILVERIPLIPSDVGRAALVDFYRRSKKHIVRKIWNHASDRLKLLHRRRVLSSR